MSVNHLKKLGMLRRPDADSQAPTAGRGAVRDRIEEERFMQANRQPAFNQQARTMNAGNRPAAVSQFQSSQSKTVGRDRQLNMMAYGGRD